MPKNFTRTIEDFTCENCGFHVVGNGYTNHCPHCLFSKHVDINPGDRLEACGGMMKPIGVEKTPNGFDVIHKCLKCGVTRKNKAARDDNFDEVLKLSTNPIAN
jgi:hypothetical protein